jgi:flagellar motor protein MotB
MKSKESNFFWPSYTDLMTSLFFIMLVLYILTFVQLKLQQKVTEDQLNKIQQVQAMVKELDKRYFTYQPEYKRFILNRDIHFEKGSDIIAFEDIDYLKKVGVSINTLIRKLEVKYASEHIKYLIVIEGMSSLPHYYVDEYHNNDVLSYQRALGLLRLWNTGGITFDPSVCEVQVAGSGERGVGRDKVHESANQRFLIQIIPKIGEVK